MTAKFFAILTNQGAAKLANAASLGTKLNLTQMALGDANGVLPTPDAAQTQLINQKRIAPLNRLSVDPNNTNQIIAEQVIPENEGGFWIREIGLYDDDGVLIAIANCPETYKPLLQEGSGRTQTIRMALIVSSTAAVTLKIDPSVVLATRKYVDDKVIEVKAYSDELMKQHVAASNPHAQYAPIANPTFTGTPKAPTAAQTSNDTQLANTAFVQAAIAALVSGDLAKKQPLDNTLTDLSGKNAAAILEYLGLGELAKTPRFLVSKGENANGWYEIYSDGYKRVGQSWSSPLAIPTPAIGVRVSYPVSFTTKLSGLFITENGNTSNNFEFANPALIGITGFNIATMESTIGSSPSTNYGAAFTGFYVAEGY